jgi:hypothetical protein
MFEFVEHGLGGRLFIADGEEAIGLACHVDVPPFVAVDRRLSQPATDCHNRRGSAGEGRRVAAGCGMSHSRENRASGWPIKPGET